MTTAHRLAERVSTWCARSQHGGVGLRRSQGLQDAELAAFRNRQDGPRRSVVLSNAHSATVGRIANLVDDPVSIVAATRCPDHDCPVALARQHQADHIVTGDKDLFEWDDQVLPAITPAAFEDLLNARSHP